MKGSKILPTIGSYWRLKKDPLMRVHQVINIIDNGLQPQSIVIKDVVTHSVATMSIKKFDADYINQRAESLKNKITGVIPYLTTRFEVQIMSVNGNKDKLFNILHLTIFSIIR